MYIILHTEQLIVLIFLPAMKETIKNKLIYNEIVKFLNYSVIEKTE